MSTASAGHQCCQYKLMTNAPSPDIAFIHNNNQLSGVGALHIPWGKTGFDSLAGSVDKEVQARVVGANKSDDIDDSHVAACWKKWGGNNKESKDETPFPACIVVHDSAKDSFPK